jgi:hypothetical protein
MNVLTNRFVSIYYLILSALPIGLLVVVLNYGRVNDGWNKWNIVTAPATYFVLAIVTIGLSAATWVFSSPTRRVQGYLVCFSVLLVVCWGFLLFVIPAIISSVPMWNLWRTYSAQKA